MTNKKDIKASDSFRSLENAIQRFSEALREDPSSNILAIDGAIQRFEFCFE